MKFFVQFLILCLLVSCADEDLSGPSFNTTSNNINSSQMLTTGLINQRLNDFARLLATSQDDYKENLIKSMKNSKIKENIINLSLANINSREIFNKFTKLVEYNSQIFSSDLSLLKFLKTLPKDLNIYFPVDAHRKNVLENGQTFIVGYNPPRQLDEEYHFTAFDNEGNSIKLSSKIVPNENVLILAYSENQEKYSINAKLCGDCGGEDDPDQSGGGSGGGGPNEVTYYDGLRVKRIKTKGIHDGWADGDLELRVQITQETVYVNDYKVNGTSFTEDLKYHDAGTWEWGVNWKESNKWSYINHYRRWSERAHTTVLGVKIYNDEFVIEVIEEDPFDDDEIGKSTFFLDTHAFGSDFLVSGGSEKCWVTLDSGSYASSKYGIN